MRISMMRQLSIFKRSEPGVEFGVGFLESGNLDCNFAVAIESILIGAVLLKMFDFELGMAIKGALRTESACLMSYMLSLRASLR
jgi:hypothetical protein